ncbi:MAG: ferredoxin, partial [archaeon]
DHDRNVCIGCAACANVAPEYWFMENDGKSSVKGHKMEGPNEVLDITDAQYKDNREAADACPVNCIHIIDKKDNKKLI